MAEELGWGAGGVQAFQQYDQQAQLFQQTKQENALKIEEEGITVQKGKIELAQQRKMMDLMEQRDRQKQLTPGMPQPTNDPVQERVSQLNEFADLYLAADQPEKARELYTAASTVANQHSEIVHRQAEDDTAKWGTVASLVDVVTDQKSWQQAQLVFQQTHPDWAATQESKKLFEMPFSPELMKIIKNTSMTQLQQAQLKQRQAAAVASTSELAVHEAEVKRDLAQARNYDDLITNRNKAGGKNLTPNSSDVKVITDLMKDDYGDPADLTEASRFNNRAMRAAEQMKDLMRQGIPKSVASTRAYQEAKQRGDFGGLRRVREQPGDFGKPLAMPQNKDDLRDNLYYLGKNGQIGRWDKTSGKFILPEANQPAAGKESDDDDEPAE